MNPITFVLLALLAVIAWLILMPAPVRYRHSSAAGRFTRRALRLFKLNSELGGYVHDTAMCQVIPCTAFHPVTGTWSYTAGPTSGTISRHKAAAAETAVINIPITIPQNSVTGKGSLLKYVELDHEITSAAATSITLSMNKVTMGADTASPTVAAVTGTQTLTPATSAATADQHRDKWTLTTPAYIKDDEQYLLVVTAVCASGTVLDFLGARAYFTERL